ncbi:enoyl-CoA hydratase-related protein [Acidomonas methanolica]|uniref:Enoyl-CoA hydratase n=1 Tax=Acidomonas methanolica NBRC 104435 TaxID=1231351 RepID=A0A023D330_ACIMT|nr:enoyl-CoA hydratase-related protein [Acidomonas methanolica]MBU2654087.1 enoyl-CoA hydratase/isomerase family protein [Acidomonas methanolica]TCS30684.1 enoyl-CoA hydratase [Acidomonas methanolica]GAJ28186.1 enoyl-CoA hydratase [Acidomonas methanolica NBRC 104435]GBQ49216.1 enoyl-CoA hydratase [Acidomonas methanolica]GEK98928.1 enoyl-CoA hydratase [Acidomonas methanolica NBRC 104435]
MPDIEISSSGGILSLVLNRPAKRNALTDAMYGTLADAFAHAGSDRATRVILLAGEGESFTAGNDIADFVAVTSGTAAGRASGPGNVLRFLDALATCTLPLVSAAQGHAVGIGTTLLLHCDHVVLGESARLSTPFVNLALVPEAASSLLIPRRIGHARAYAMFALAEIVTAEQAVAWGLANAVVPDTSLREAALDVAGRLAAQPREALAITKRLMRDTATIRARMDEENDAFMARLRSPEAMEAFTAFAERRKPDFSRFD